MADGFTLPKVVAADMLKEAFEGKRQVKTVQNTNTADGKSLKQQAIDAHQEFSNSISPALKKMKLAYFEKVADQCYPDKWLSESFTNQEQIDLCKAEKNDAVFGKLNKMIQNHRQSDVMRLNDCRADASRDVFFEYKCFETYVTNVRATNEKMKAQFASDYSKYM